MGARKHNRAEAIKEARKNVAIAHLNDTPTSPYKMRLVADMIRGQKVELRLRTPLSRFTSCSVRPSPTGKPRTKASALKTATST